jgi:Multicopper oxidase
MSGNMERTRKMNRLPRLGIPAALLAATALTLGTATQVASARTSPAVMLSVADVTLDICAKPGSTTLPGAPLVTIWGYVLGDCTGPAVPVVPGGPAIEAIAGQTVEVRLHNDLPKATGLFFQGQSMTPDRTGAPAGGAKTYSFVAKAGTTVYEAGLLPGAQYQPAMGLYGALIVRPAAAGQAYDGFANSAVTTAYNHESPIVLSEIDPALNSKADPWTFDMRTYHPTYGLINGKAGKDIDMLPFTAGTRELLRIVNAGIQPHSIGVLGLHQSVVGNDGSEASAPRRLVAETIGSGQSSDAIVTIPASAGGSKLAIYDASLSLHNGGAAGIGGMVAFLDVASGGTPVPVTTGVAVTPNPALSTVTSVQLAAQVTPVPDSVRFNLDGIANGWCTTGDVATNLAISPTGAVTAGIDTAGTTLYPCGFETFAVGAHTVTVQGHNVTGWGPAVTTTLNVIAADTAGPTTSGVVATPAITNGADVALSANISDAATGASAISAAEYLVGPAPSGAGFPMVVTTTGPATATALVTVPYGSLTAGANTLSVRSQDAAGNWGDYVSVTVTAGDIEGPVTTSVTASPTATSSADVTITAEISDAATGGSYVTDAEYIVSGTQPAPGTVGTPMTVGPAVTTTATATITAASLTEGANTVWVHGKDAAGNTGVYVSVSVKKDTVGPTSTLAASSAVTVSADVLITASLTDATSGSSIVTEAEFVVPPGATSVVVSAAPAGAITATATVLVPFAALLEGPNTVSVRGRDALGNLGASTSIVVYKDTLGPATTGVITSGPNPTNGTVGVTSTNPSVRVTATVTDLSTNIVAAEGFLNPTTAPAVGTRGFVFLPVDGVWDSRTEQVYSDIPLTSLTHKVHSIGVRGKDALGHWTVATTTVTLTVDKQAPAMAYIAPTPAAASSTNASGGTSTFFTVSATATEVNAPKTGVVKMEWYDVVGTAAGSGTTMCLVAAPDPALTCTTTIDFVALGWNQGNHTIYIRALDSVGNWSVGVARTFNIVYPNLFSNGFDTMPTATLAVLNSTPWVLGGTAGRVSVVAGNAQGGSAKHLAVSVSGATSGFVQDNTPNTGTYRSRFYVNPNGLTTGTGTVAAPDGFGTAANPRVVTLYRGLTGDGSGTTLFEVQYRRSNTTNYQVRLYVLGAAAPGAWFTIQNGNYTSIEVFWQNGVTATMATNGTVRPALVPTGTLGNTVGSVQIGVQPVAGGTLGNITSGPVRFDSFFSTTGATFP